MSLNQRRDNLGRFAPGAVADVATAAERRTELARAGTSETDEVGALPPSVNESEVDELVHNMIGNYWAGQCTCQGNPATCGRHRLGGLYRGGEALAAQAREIAAASLASRDK